MADARLFRSANEAIAHHRGAVENKDDPTFTARVWHDFHETHPGLDPDRVEQVIAQHWDELEKMPTHQAMAVLARAAGGRGQQAPEPDQVEPADEPSLRTLINKRKEVRRQFSVVNPRRTR
jgi:hypothetical protein